MAACAACIRVGRFGTNTVSNITGLRGLAAPSFVSPSDWNRNTFDFSATRSSALLPCISPYRKFDGRYISKLATSNRKRLFLVDTLIVVRKLEEQGMPTNQAEAITSSITGVLYDTLEYISQSVVSKDDMQKSELIKESNLSKFKSEIQSAQEHHFSLLQHENEKLRNDIEKMRHELRHEIDKVTAGQRLDLNLEKGMIRDELANQNAGTAHLTNKLDREIHELRAQMEAGKYDVIKYCIGSLVSICAVGLAGIRIFM